MVKMKFQEYVSEVDEEVMKYNKVMISRNDTIEVLISQIDSLKNLIETK